MPFINPFSSSGESSAEPWGALIDLDGCLADTAPGLLLALRRAFADLDVPMPEDWDIRKLVGGGARAMVEAAIVKAGRPIEDRIELLAGFESHYAGIVCDPTSDDALFPDAADVLRDLRASGARLALCTNKRERFALPLIERLEARALFDAFVCGDTTDAMKPDPKPLLEALRRLGVAPSRAIMVGDSDADIDGARAAGVRGVAATFGYGYYADALPPASALRMDAWRALPQVLCAI